MKISVIYISNRPGSIDLLCSSLATQEGNVDWELIVVDGYEGRVQRGKAEQYLRDHKLPIRYYGLPKAKLFSWSRTGFCNAMNTGLFHVTGDYVVFLHDYTRILETALRDWVLMFTQTGDHCLVHGVAINYETEPPEREDDIVTWNNPSPWRPRDPWVPNPFEVGYWGGPITFFDRCNGIDERADFRADWALNCVMAQAACHGYKLHVDARLICHMVDHRVWHKGPHSTDSVWKTWLEGGQDIPEPVWTYWSANSFHLAYERFRNRGGEV